MAYDFKKEYKSLYLPKHKPSIIEVPAMTFVAVAGDEVLLFKISTKAVRKQPDTKTTARKHSTSTQLDVEQSKLAVG